MSYTDSLIGEMRRSLRSLCRFVKRVVRTGEYLATTPRLPRWLRWLFVFGLLPVPLFLDEAALVLAVAIMAVFYSAEFRAAWLNRSL